jgi:hypothetical protein
MVGIFVHYRVVCFEREGEGYFQRVSHVICDTTHTCSHTSVHTHTYICTSIFTHLCTYIHTYIYTYVCTRTRTNNMSLLTYKKSSLQSVLCFILYYLTNFYFNMATIISLPPCNLINILFLAPLQITLHNICPSTYVVLTSPCGLLVASGHGVACKCSVCWIRS